ncbi:hypothetical protein [Acinetobacter brisouii]|uniref:hypothetical protein n=1 Tax=Acinetobacter brisouii TaxID=396323 RepID=UPI00124BDC8A|nr:hypothetical protein [Acinetobacter brisouii]
MLTETREPSPELLEALRDIHAAKVPMIALCSACFVLGNAGLLDGLNCAIHFTTRDEFATFLKLSPLLTRAMWKTKAF